MLKDQIYVLSRCLERRDQSFGFVHFKFHFNGVYRGERIRYILVQADRGCHFEVNEDYLLLLKAYIIKDNILLTSLLKSRII